jgi:hypothetical protein
LPTSYGSISIDDCRVHIHRVYTIGQRNSQDDSILAGSITESFEKEIKTQPAVYTINIARGDYRSVILFHKLVLSKAQTDTVATVTLLRTKVLGLSENMNEMQGNIVDFNTYVKSLINDFLAYGANCDEKMPIVFWAYLTVEDNKLVRLAELLQDEWMGAPGTPLHSFMTRTEKEYNIQVKMGTWKAPTKQATEILAIKAPLHQAKNTTTPKKNESNGNGYNGSGNKSNMVTPYKSYAERTEEERTTIP